MISSVLTQFCFQCFRPFDRFLFLCCLAVLLVFLQNQSNLKRFWNSLGEVYVAKHFFCFYFAEIIFKQFFTFLTGFSFCAVWPYWSFLSKF